MEKSVKMTEYFKMYQRAPEGRENRTYKFLYVSAKWVVNTERYKTNRDRRQTTEYDFVPGPFRGRNRENKRGAPHKDAVDKYERKIKKREKAAKLPKKDRPDPDKTPLCRFFLLGECQKGNGCEFRHSKETQRVVMAVGLTGPGPDSQKQKLIVCRQFSERGSCSFGDRCKFFHDASISSGKPNPNSRGATPKTTPKGTPRGTPSGTPRGGTPKKDPKDKRHKSSKPSAVAEVVEIDAESPAESSSSSEEEASECESDDSLSTSREQGSSSPRE